MIQVMKSIIINECEKMASKSPVASFRHGAVLTHRGKIIASDYNDYFHSQTIRDSKLSVCFPKWYQKGDCLHLPCRREGYLESSSLPLFEGLQTVRC